MAGPRSERLTAAVVLMADGRRDGVDAALPAADGRRNGVDAALRLAEEDWRDLVVVGSLAHGDRPEVLDGPPRSGGGSDAVREPDQRPHGRADALEGSPSKGSDLAIQQTAGNLRFQRTIRKAGRTASSRSLGGSSTSVLRSSGTPPVGGLRCLIARSDPCCVSLSAGAGFRRVSRAMLDCKI